MTPNATKVIIADDHPHFLMGLATDLGARADIRVVCTLPNGAEVINRLTAGTPADILLLDLEMPIMSGLDVLEAMKSIDHGARAIALSADSYSETIRRSMALGAWGYVCKEDELATVYTAIRHVMQGERYISPLGASSMAMSMVHQYRQSPDSQHKAALTDRDLAIIKGICDRKTMQQIARQLHVGKRTIEGDKAALIKKTGTGNTAGLILYAKENDLV
jgi:DNA-binding NarL/FixJ family response regulator